MDPKELANLFRYHPPLPGQLQKYERLRGAAHIFAQAVIAEVPAGPDRSASVRKIREAVMTANAGIACHCPDREPTLQSSAQRVVRSGAKLDRHPAP